MTTSSTPGETQLPPILVVDDDPTQRLMFRKVLEKDGHRVIEAEHGKQALGLFEEHRPLLALVDAIMPEMDGFELSKRLHTMEGGEELTILMATSLSDDADINHAFQAGAADFINKPINWTVLRGRVKHLLEAKVAQIKMRNTEAQLRQAQKMNAIGNLSSGIAHEFNNILASIMGYTELLQEYLGHADATKPLQYADEVYSAATRARDLVNQMQLFSQTMPGKPQRLDLKPLIKQDLKMLRSTLPTTIQLQQRLAEELPPVLSDPAQFQQMLTNLLINARDAIDGKGFIGVATKQIHCSDHICNSCHEHFSGEFVQLSISDSGSGMPKDVIEKIFDPYFTTKPVGRGTGMGLSVVHGIMHEMHGHITIASQPDEGTTINLLFPIETTAKSNNTRSGQKEETAMTDDKNHKILLVDDEISITGYLSELLEMHGYAVITCNDSQQALTQFIADPNAIDLVITDMTLPGLTGIELAEGILHLRPDLPIVLCSGYIDDATQQAIKDSGIREAFCKPVDSSALISRIGQLLREHDTAA